MTVIGKITLAVKSLKVIGGHTLCPDYIVHSLNVSAEYRVNLSLQRLDRLSIRSDVHN